MDMTLTQADIKAIAVEVAALIGPLLGCGVATAPVALPRALDEDRVRHEDTQLLEAKRTMSEPDYIVFQAEIMAARAETLGQYQTASRIRKLAKAKAVKLAKMLA